jgi:uncharacterized protein (UPF0248 family)
MEVATLVEKELIDSLHFPKGDVLFSKEEQLIRAASLDRAMRLGNVSHSKLNIYFEDVEGAKVVCTTIWGVTERYIILKKNITIPIHRILKIN